MSENVRLTCEKLCFLESLRILQLFTTVQSDFLKNDSIFVFSVLMLVFWTVRRIYSKRIFFFNFTTGDLKLWSQSIKKKVPPHFVHYIVRNEISGKKKKKVKKKTTMMIVKCLTFLNKIICIYIYIYIYVQLSWCFFKYIERKKHLW